MSTAGSRTPPHPLTMRTPISYVRRSSLISALDRFVESSDWMQHPGAYNGGWDKSPAPYPTRFLEAALPRCAPNRMYLSLTTLLSHILLWPVLGVSVLKGSDDGVMHVEESCFRTLSIVQCFFFKNVSEAGSASVFRRLALSKGPHRVGATPFPPLLLPEDGSRASFRNVVFKEKTLDDE
jgi:hypothetical protein